MMKAFYKKYILVLCGILACSFTVNGQNFSSFAQYYQMPYLVNPGFTSIQGFSDVQVGTKQQSSGFKQAPKSYFVGVNHAVGVNQGKNKHIDVDNPNIEKNTSTRFGISAFLNQTNFQGFNNLDAGLSYAIHLPVSSSYHLSFGLSTLFSRTRADMDQFIVRDQQDEFYKNLMSADGSLRYFNMNAGLSLYSDHFFGGYSAMKVTSSRLTKLEGGFERIPLSHVVFAGYNFPINKSLEMIPTIIVQYSEVDGSDINLNIKARYLSKFWVGSGFSPNRSLNAVLGFAFSPKLNVNYSYENSLSKIQGYPVNSHEIVLGWTLANKKNLKPFLW